VDAVVSDVVMPGMGGPELVERLRELRPGLPALYVSGYTDGVLEDAGMLKPGVRLLQKPYRVQALVTEVGELFNARAGVPA
jgi:CheY-like chemotaxis protein